MAPPAVLVTVNGTDRTANVRCGADGSLDSMVDHMLDTPNTIGLRVSGFTPVKGQVIKIGLGGVSTLDQLEFAGHILKVAQVYESKPANVAYDLECIDYTWQLGHRFVTKKYLSMDADDIIADIMTNFAPAGFTVVNVVAGLPAIDEITFTNVKIPEAISRVMERIGGYWYVDYLKDVHAFLTETGGPNDITDADGQGVEGLTVTDDISQILTRVTVEGGGAQTTADVAAGATAIPVADTNWYDAGGGTVMSGPQQITYAGIGGSLTPATVQWVSRTPAAANSWYALTWSPELSVFVAVAYTGTNRVMTSPDGITWTARSAAEANTWLDVCWSPELSLFVAVSSDGTNRVMTSPDGITWTARAASAVKAWVSVTWSPSLSLFVAVASDTGTASVMTSPTGTTWTTRTSAVGFWNKIAWSPSLSIFVAVGSVGGTNRAMSSPDGITWTARTATDVLWHGVAWSPELGLFVAVSTNIVMTSANGTSWTDRTPPNGWWRAITWSPDLALFVVLGTSSGSTFLITSPDGINWTGGSAQVGDWMDVSWAPSIATFAAVGRTTEIKAMTGASSLPITYGTLTGIPSSGAGSILYDIKTGDEVNLLVTRNDTSAQTALAALMGGDGIVEDYMQDRRLSQLEAENRGDAQLALYSTVLQKISYQNRDPNAGSGKSITVNLGAPTNISATQKIQEVEISQLQIRPGTEAWPLRKVTATSQLYSFSDMLRRLKRLSDKNS